MIDDSRKVKAPKVKPAKPPHVKPSALTSRALAFWGNPTIGEPTIRALNSYARSAAIDAASADWEREQYPLLAESALRALITASPDYQTS